VSLHGQWISPFVSYCATSPALNPLWVRLLVSNLLPSVQPEQAVSQTRACSDVVDELASLTARFCGVWFLPPTIDYAIVHPFDLADDATMELEIGVCTIVMSTFHNFGLNISIKCWRNRVETSKQSH
jgi:hypothetical protein